MKCKCGCGEEIVSKWQKYQKISYIKGHARRGKKNSEEHNLALKKANTKSKEVECSHCKKIILKAPARLKWKNNYCDINCYAKALRGRKIPEESVEKMRLSRIGHIVSNETRNKISIANSGENNGCWLGGISFEEYSLNFNRKFKKLIKIRDNGSCVICGSNKRLAVHHIDYNKINTCKENCISLCASCHSKTNFNRKYWSRFFQSMLSDNYGYIKFIGGEYGMQIEKVLG